MDGKELRRLNKLYGDLLNYYFDNGRPDMDFDNKPWANFLDALYPYVRGNRYYDHELYESSVMWHLEAYDKKPEQLSGLIDDLLKHINAVFEVNKDIHFIVFPLQGSGLKQDIHFSDFHFLQHKEEEALVEQIANIAGIERSSVNDFFQHTKNSRSPDFLNDNMILIRVENQTNSIGRTCTFIAKQIINYLHLVYIAFGLESSVFRLGGGWQQDNYHVAVLAKDSWRRRHSPVRDIPLQCKIDLDFMMDRRFQTLFCDLYSTYVEGKCGDELADKFLNALILFGRGYSQRTIHHDDSLALLLYITAIESLLTEGKNEKRLRLCAIVSRIIPISGYTQAGLAKLLDALYRKRNDFLHAGEFPRFTYDDNQLTILEQTVAKLIIKYFDINSLIKLEQGESRYSGWNKYIDKLFIDIIYSNS